MLTARLQQAAALPTLSNFVRWWRYYLHLITIFGVKMKKLLIAFLMAPGISFSGLSMSSSLSSVPAAQQSQQQSQSAEAAASNAGNNQTITVEAAQPLARTETVISGTQTVKNTPSVSGPSLTTSNDTCMGSTSGSVNIAGIGIGGGSTWTDTNCKRLKNARELWNMGMRAASLALMCMDDENRRALEATGFKCATTDQDVLAGDLDKLPPTAAGPAKSEGN